MTEAIENPILNSPYEQPDRYFEIGPQGPTGVIGDGRRPSESFIPIAVSKKGRTGADQIEIDFDATGERRERNTLINDLRQQVDRFGVYNIQRVYLAFLGELAFPGEAAAARGNHPGGRGELVYYQLGKFSQVISDFEQIYFTAAPEEKYQAFVAWLTHQAPDYYAESDADVGYAAPDAVTLSTVHQAKGMQWPVVFVPCLRRNRFPLQRHGGLGLFHVLPQESVEDPDRYRGTVEDETRLFYVAVTRAQKYLNLTYSPGDTSRYRNRSVFFDHCADQRWVSTRPSTRPLPERVDPAPRQEVPQLTFSFSELKYLFECPYSFKLRFLYGFNPPLHEALGYGKGLHDALAEVHKKAIDGQLLDASDATELVERHPHTPPRLPRTARDAGEGRGHGDPVLLRHPRRGDPTDRAFREAGPGARRPGHYRRWSHRPELATGHR